MYKYIVADGCRRRPIRWHISLPQPYTMKPEPTILPDHDLLPSVKQRTKTMEKRSFHCWIVSRGIGPYWEARSWLNSGYFLFKYSIQIYTTLSHITYTRYGACIHIIMIVRHGSKVDKCGLGAPGFVARDGQS